MTKIPTIGPSESLILFQLYRYPDQLVQWIEKGHRTNGKKIDGIGKDYKTIREGILRLEKKGFVESVTIIKTQKGKEERAFRLSDKGIAWVFAYGCVDLDKIPEAYFDLGIVNLVRKISSSLAPGKKPFGQFLSKVFKIYLTLLDDPERDKISNEEALEYVFGASMGYLMTKLDDKDFKLAEKPQPIDKETFNQTLFYWQKMKKDLDL